MIHKIDCGTEWSIDDGCDLFIKGNHIKLYSLMVDDVHDLVLNRLYGNAHSHVYYDLKKDVNENRI